LQLSHAAQGWHACCCGAVWHHCHAFWCSCGCRPSCSR
jgi:hypothetical protein